MTTDVCRTRVAIVDDQRLFAEGLARIVTSSGMLDVVAIASGPGDLPVLARERQPHVVVLDYRLADDTGLAAAPAIRRTWPEARVLVVTGFASDHTRQQARAAGCHGFVSKDESPDTLISAIAAIARDETVGFDGTYRDGEALTARELEVLALLAEGCNATEIAQRLYIGVVTVRNHVQRILRKLDASTQLEAVIVGMRRGLVDPPAARERDDPDAR